MEQSGYTFRVGSGSGTLIDERMFGVNILFQNDRVDSDSTFPQVVADVSASYIRYPGGTVTEQYFDLGNPDASVQQNFFNPSQSVSVLPISEFLAFSKANGISTIIVLPTYRYFDSTTRSIINTAEVEIKTFVRNLLSGNFGDVDIYAFEIGNEWYQDRFNWTAAEFGDLQGNIALWIREAILNFSPLNEPQIFIQAGRGDDDQNGIDDNLELSSALSAQELNAIDGVVTHLYASTSSGDPLVLGGAIDARLNEIEEIWQSLSQNNVDLVITEWNIGEDGAANTTVNGLMRSCALLRLFATMVGNDVDLATIWTTQAGSPAALSDGEGGGTDLSPTGYLFRMLSQTLSGMQLVDPEDDFHILNRAGDELGYTYTFEQTGRTVVYFVSGSAAPMNIHANFQQLIQLGTTVNATRLFAEPGTTGIEFDASAAILVQSLDPLEGAIRGDRIFDISLRPYELIQIEFVTGQAISVGGDDRLNLRDNITGSILGDTLSGFGGNDTISGASGSDLLSPGSGNDLVQGGTGNDTIIGSSGEDSISGGSGVDTLDFSDGVSGVFLQLMEGRGTVGDSMQYFDGIEVLIGSEFHDNIFIGQDSQRIFGGGGSDTMRSMGGSRQYLFGGEGNDFIQELGRNSYLFGDAGDDTILSDGTNNTISGGSGDDLCFIGNTGGLMIGGAGSDTLMGGSGVDIFEFGRNSGSDTITGFSIGFDRIRIDDWQGLELRIFDSGADVIVTGAGFSIVIEDIDYSSFHSNSIVLF